MPILIALSVTPWPTPDAPARAPPDAAFGPAPAALPPGPVPAPALPAEAPPAAPLAPPAAAAAKSGAESATPAPSDVASLAFDGLRAPWERRRVVELHATVLNNRTHTARHSDARRRTPLMAMSADVGARRGSRCPR